MTKSGDFTGEKTKPIQSQSGLAPGLVRGLAVAIPATAKQVEKRTQFKANPTYRIHANRPGKST
jgi:hypothetical protein